MCRVPRQQLLGGLNDPLPTFLSTQQLSGLLGVSIRKLERDRQDGTGVLFVKFGRRVLYRRADVEAFLKAQRFSSTAEAQRVKEGR